MSARRRARRADRKLLALSAVHRPLLAADVRQLLSVVESFAEVLRKFGDVATASRHRRQIRRSAKIASTRLIDEFIEACVIKDPDSSVQSTQLLDVHNAWARATSNPEYRAKGLSNALVLRGFRKRKSSCMHWVGIRMAKGVKDFIDRKSKTPSAQVRPRASRRRP